jgi:DNA-binding transcriptional LysR family regulator
MPMDRLDDMEAFLAVVENGSLTAATRHNGISPVRVAARLQARPHVRLRAIDAEAHDPLRSMRRTMLS